jgi:hypothetical protein
LQKQQPETSNQKQNTPAMIEMTFFFLLLRFLLLFVFGF